MFIVHLAPNHHCSLSLQQILGLFDPRYLCMVVEALCLPPTYKSHPVHCLYRIRQRHAPWPDEPLIPAHLDRERNRRWAEHCGSVNEIGAFAWFMVPRWNFAPPFASQQGPASTGEWSPTKASGLTRTSAFGDYFLMTRYLI